MPISWEPNDYNDPVIKKFISELKKLTDEYSIYVKAAFPGRSGLMIKGRKNNITLMEYQPIRNKMIVRIDHWVRAGISDVQSAEYQSAINNFGPAVTDSNIPIFIDLLKKIFDNLFLKSNPEDNPLSHGEDLPHLQKEVPYLPTKDDFHNARRKILLKDGERKILVDEILDIMEDNLFKAGRSMAEDWRSVVRNNIILWTKEN